MAQQNDLSRINEALNESMKKKIAPEGEGKEKSARLKVLYAYRGGTIDVYDEAGSSDEFFE